MHTILPLEALGQRIIVLGPTNSGKSTLALALSRRLDIPAVYLDQLRHLPDTMWVQRPDEEFGALHDQAILADTWVIDGSYSRWMPSVCNARPASSCWTTRSLSALDAICGGLPSRKIASGA